MPTSPYFTDSFQDIIANVLGIFYMLSFLYPVSRFIKVLVVEKETKIKEGNNYYFYTLYIFFYSNEDYGAI